MIIVMGWLRVAAEDRDAYLAACRPVIRAARAAPGCAEFHLSPDPVEADRINVVERWESVADVEAFRGSGPSDDQQVSILAAEVVQYEVASALGL